MRTTFKPRKPSVQFSDPQSPSGAEISVSEFLQQCQESAQVRFGGAAGRPCRTIEYVVPPRRGDFGSTGKIVAHLSAELYAKLLALTPGDEITKIGQIESEVRLALQDVADQNMHGFLALTEEQRAFFDPDLAQLIAEAFSRTELSHVDQPLVAHWEGTLVTSVRPPRLLLVISVGL